jgi:hypothetical protein
MIPKILYILLLLPVLLFGQERQKLYGRVVAQDIGMPNVYVINKVTGSETKTDYNGYFYLEVRIGDGLAVNGKGIETRDFTVNATWFESPPVVLAVEVEALQLEEVKVEGQPDEESLGLVPKGQKQYTPAERKLKTATSGLGIGTIVALDPIINAISGRTKMLKRALATEKQEFLLDDVKALFGKTKIMETYKIPEENVNGFYYYVVEDAEFASAMKSGNETVAKFLMTGLAEKYLEVIKDE